MAASTPLRFAAPLDGKVNFCYHIKRFSTTLDMKAGEVLESSSQTVKMRGVKSEWTLQVYPGGLTDKDAGFVSVYLCVKTAAALPLKSRFSFSFVKPALDCNSSEESVDAKRDLEHTFTNLGGYGFAQFVRRSVISSAANKYLRNDTLTVAVDATITFDGDDERRPAESPRLQLHAHLHQLGSINLYRLSAPSRVTIRCWNAGSGGGEPRLLLGTLSVHRPILSGVSKTFQEMLAGKAVVDVDDTTLDSLRRFIDLIYTGELECDELPESACDLLHLANRFGVEKLKEQLDGFLATRPMTVVSVAHLLPIADKCAAKQLLAACKDFFKANWKAVLDSDAFHPRILSDRTAKEMYALVNTFPTESDTFHDCEIRILQADGDGVMQLIETIPANRLILCRRSAVFKAKFDKNNHGLASPNSVDVDLFGGAEVRRLLSAMMGDGLDDESLSTPCTPKLGSSSAAESLLSIAHFYQVDDLISLCERHLSQRIDLDNVFRLLKSADRHSSMSLKGACMTFIRANVVEAAAHPTFPSIFELGIPLFKEVFVAIAK